MTPTPATQITITVAGEETGERLDRVLARHVAELSRSRLKSLIENGAVTLDGRTIRDPNHRVNSGNALMVDVPPPEPAKPEPEPIPLDVVYEDDDIIVINKPRNLVVHPAAGHATGTLVNALIAHCGDSLSGIGGERRPGIVHRLDKDTTGLMVVAKNDRAHRKLAAQFADHGRSGEPFERSYLAFVWEAPDRPHGTIDKPIDRHPFSRDRMAIREGGREAITHWQVLERYLGPPELRPGQEGGGQVVPQQAGRRNAGLPAGNRADPSDSGPFGRDWPSFIGGRGLWIRFPHQNRAFAPGGPDRAGRPWQAGAPFPYIDGETPLDRGILDLSVGTTT